MSQVVPTSGDNERKEREKEETEQREEHKTQRADVRGQEHMASLASLEPQARAEEAEAVTQAGTHVKVESDPLKFLNSCVFYARMRDSAEWESACVAFKALEIEEWCFSPNKSVIFRCDEHMGYRVAEMCTSVVPGATRKFEISPATSAQRRRLLEWMGMLRKEWCWGSLLIRKFIASCTQTSYRVARLYGRCIHEKETRADGG